MALNIRTESTIAVTLLLLLQVLTSASAIVLLSRMAPALEQVLTENDYSIQAAEEMLVVVALLQDAPPESRDVLAQRFLSAFERARVNVTEVDEQPILDAITALHPAGLSGDLDARKSLIERLSALSAINRASMHLADTEAQRLGRAGAWASFALALLTSFLGVLAMRRFNLRLVRPLFDLHDTSTAIYRGDFLRRCPKPSTDTPVELADISDAFNRLLDERVASQQQPPSPSSPAVDSSAALPAADPQQHSPLPSEPEQRAALLFLLDRLPDASCLLNAQAQILAANSQGFDLLSCAHGAAARAAFAAAPGQPAAVEGLSLTPTQIRDGLWLCTLAYTL